MLTSRVVPVVIGFHYVWISVVVCWFDATVVCCYPWCGGAVVRYCCSAVILSRGVLVLSRSALVLSLLV